MTPVLAALGVAGCTAQGAPRDERGSIASDRAATVRSVAAVRPVSSTPPRPAVAAAAAARLPHRLGVVFERVYEPRGDGMTGMMARYELPGSGAWATVFVYDDDDDEAEIPAGLDSDAIRRVLAENLHVARGNAEGGATERTTVQIPDAPPRACAVGRVARDGREIANYGGATGAGGVILKVRVTASLAPGDARERHALDRVARVLLVDVTRTVAGHSPFSVGTAPGAKAPEAPGPRGGPSGHMPGRTLRL